MKKRIITALLIPTASVPALAAYSVSKPAQAVEVIVRMCHQQLTGIEKNKAISEVYNTMGEWSEA